MRKKYTDLTELVSDQPLEWQQHNAEISFFLHEALRIFCNIYANFILKSKLKEQNLFGRIRFVWGKKIVNG